jgi:hypothetical protein
MAGGTEPARLRNAELVAMLRDVASEAGNNVQLEVVEQIGSFATSLRFAKFAEALLVVVIIERMRTKYPAPRPYAFRCLSALAR